MFRPLWQHVPLSSDRDRKMTIILTPFMSCSAKLPIYGMIIAAFFPHKAAIVMLSNLLYWYTGSDYFSNTY